MYLLSAGISPRVDSRATAEKATRRVADEPSQEIQVELPEDLDVGVYANFALVQSGEHDFVIDFCQLTPPREEGDSPRARVVSRVRIAPTFVGPLLQALSQNAFNRDEKLKQARSQQEGGGMS
jgi:hypothetical protein